MNHDKIYMVGFVASGKSTVARIVGRRVGWRIEDIDDLIEHREGRKVAEIFEREGEGYFRAVERDVLRGLLPLRHAVVATGSGTFVDPDNRALVNRDGASVWLDAPLDVLLSRLPADRPRPLGTDRHDIERLYAIRQLAYRQAHLRLDAAGAGPDELAERILDWLGY